jgi:hypothetical protein
MILIKKIKNTENYDDWIEYVEDRPFNDKRYYISNQKIKDLGWNITINLEKGQVGEIYNIGCDEGMEFSVMQIAHILIKLIKNTENYDDWIEYIDDRPFNDKRYYISNQKLKDLGWSINIDLMTGLKNLVNV